MSNNSEEIADNPWYIPMIHEHQPVEGRNSDLILITFPVDTVSSGAEWSDEETDRVKVRYSFGSGGIRFASVKIRFH